jgi:hypothetical protein
MSPLPPCDAHQLLTSSAAELQLPQLLHGKRLPALVMSQQLVPSPLVHARKLALPHRVGTGWHTSSARLRQAKMQAMSANIANRFMPLQ